MTPGQCRAARIVLGWSQADLAERSGVSVPEISRFENARETLAGTGKLLRRYFETAGIRFEGDWGVCYRGKRKDRSAGPLYPRNRTWRALPADVRE